MISRPLEPHRQIVETRIRAIEKGWTNLLRTRWGPEQYADWHRAVHSLSGAAGTFGEPEVSRAAASLENFLDRAGIGAAPPDGNQVNEIRALIRDIAGSFNRPPSPSQGAPRRGTSAKREASRSTRPDPPDTVPTKIVFLVEDDADLGETIAEQLRHFGYGVRRFETLDGLEEAVRADPPDAMLMDIGLREGRFAGPQFVRTVRGIGGEGIPVVFMSGRSGFEARWQAARAGAKGFFEKPVDIQDLVFRLDLVTHRSSDRTPRILILVDHAETADLLVRILGGRGMEARLLKEPQRLLDTLSEFGPDLVIMDIQLGRYSGPELVSMIRQDEYFFAIPVLFLIDPSIHPSRLTALRTGVEPLLTKPVNPDVLLSAVTVHIGRSRGLRALMDMDGLTGLLNHSRTKERLVIEVDRARRSTSSLSLVMIDLDRFKSINDRLGHPVGDRVLRTISRFLRQQLRQTDVAGRYGGEEFMILMPHTPVEQAARVMDGLREAFSGIRLRAGVEEFHVTFSAGVAAFPDFKDPEHLVEAADKALYKAKALGRNRVSVRKGKKRRRVTGGS